MHAPRPTTAEISAADLMTRVYVFADDSMLGREAGAEGNLRATNYIARELQRLGLEPAGENGTFFQTIPLVRYGVPRTASLEVNGRSLARGTEWLVAPPIIPALPFGGNAQGELPVIFGGRAGDVANYPSPEQIRGRIVVLTAPVTPAGQPGYAFWVGGQLDRFQGAAAVAVAVLESFPPQLVGYFDQPRTALQPDAVPAGTPFGMIISAAAARELLGAEPASLSPGAAGRTVRANLTFENAPPAAPARNVVAILRGSDPSLRGQFVTIGAHSDHVGTVGEGQPVVDHDSLRAHNSVMRPRGAENPAGQRPSEAQWTQIRARLDSLRAVNPRKLDSVYNGADDDASGSMAILEIAEHLALSPQRPRRSVLFMWHTAEEVGLFGSEYYAFNPTVPRDSMVAHINADMIGRGTATDMPGGGPSYVQIIGSRRLSTQLGDLVEEVNRSGGHDFRFDYAFDADGHPDNFYCRSDHYNFARFGIPSVFFTTGSHQDYHMLTDEPQYIAYDKYARLTRFMSDVVVALGNRDQRPVVDKPVPDPMGICRQ